MVAGQYPIEHCNSVLYACLSSILKILVAKIKIRHRSKREAKDGMAKISNKSLEEIQRALEQYREVCENGLTTAASKTAYGDADRFVRWLKDEYTPGQRQ